MSEHDEVVVELQRTQEQCSTFRALLREAQAENTRQAEIIEALRAALMGCEALIATLMGHIELNKPPAALVAARAALELARPSPRDD